MKRERIGLICIMLTLLLSGCWSRELQDLAIVSATAVDLDENNQWTITYQVAIPQSNSAKSGGGAQLPVTVFSSKGRTLLEAAYNARMESPRMFFFAHNRVMVISQHAASKGINQIIDLYIRSLDRRETTDVVIYAGEAKNVLKVLTPLEKIPGNTIDSLLKDTDTYYHIPSEVHDLVSSLTSSSASIVIPEIKVSGDSPSSTDAAQKPRPSAILKLGGTGVLKQDKWAGWLTREESLGLSWVTNQLKRTTVVFPCNGEDRSGQLASFQVERARTKLKPVITGGRLSMNMDLDVEGNLLETACKLDLKTPQTIKKMEERIQQPIISDITKAFTALKKMKADAMGFGREFHKEYPEQWKGMEKDWDNKFKEIQLNVSVKATIRQTGMSNDSFSKLSDKKE